MTPRELLLQQVLQERYRMTRASDLRALAAERAAPARKARNEGRPSSREELGRRTTPMTAEQGETGDRHRTPGLRQVPIVRTARSAQPVAQRIRKAA